MSDILEMPLDLLRAALPAVSGEETRYCLRGIYFDPAGWVVATNGHVLFAAQVPAVADWAGHGNIVTGKQIEQAVKGRSTQNVALLELDRGDVIVGACGNRVLAPIIDGTFPDWRRVIPADCTDTVAPAQFLPGPRAAIDKMAKALGSTATIVPRDDMVSPHPVLFGTRTDCFAVIGPARVSFDPTAQWQLVARP